MHNRFGFSIDIASTVLFVAAIISSVVIYLLHVVTHFPFFDGSIHVRYLWLLAAGSRANVDFFCIYPTLGYFLTLPYFNLFPDSAFTLLALRIFSVVIVALIGIVIFFHGKKIINNWIIGLLPFLLISTYQSTGVFFSEYSIDHLAALAALWAMTLFMSEPRTYKLLLCAALAVVSVFIMPKYHFQLAFGMVGFLWAYYARSGNSARAIAAVLGGMAAALLAIYAIFTVNGGSLTDNVKYAFLFNFRLAAALDQQLYGSQMFSPVIVYILMFLRYHPLMSLVFLLGLAGWGKYALYSGNKPDHYILGGGGILLGCLVSSLYKAVYCEQYITPIILSLALFVPFTFSSLFSSANGIRYARLALIVVLFGKLAVRLNGVADEFELTPYNSRGNTAMHRKMLGEIAMAPTGINILNEYDDLLDIIPEDDTVVAAWPYHPLFRHDLTFQIFDDRPSLANGFAADAPLQRTFAPETFREALERKPPALIVLDSLAEFYPPGWDAVAADFLARHQGMYQKYATRLYEGYLRKDLLE